MSQFRFRVPGFTRQNPPAVSEDHSASPTNSTSYSNKFRITQFVRESKHVEGGKGSSSADETPRKKIAAAGAGSGASASATPDAAVPTEDVKLADAAKSSDASEKPEETRDATTPPRQPIALAKRISKDESALSKSKARRSLPNLKLVPPTTFAPILPFPEGRTPPPVDPSRSVEWNKVVRSIQATSLEAIVTKLLDALSDRPESGPGTLVAHLGEIFLDDATKQMYKQVRSVDPRLAALQPSTTTASNPPNGRASISVIEQSGSDAQAAPKKSNSAIAPRRSIPGAIPKPTPGGILLAPKLFEPREYKPGSARKLKRKSDADKDNDSKPFSSVKRNASAGDLLSANGSSEALVGEEPPVKRKRGRPKGSTKAAIQERESLKMQASAAEQVSENMTETATVATESVSPVQDDERQLPTGTSIELRASSPSPRPEAPVS